MSEFETFMNGGSFVKARSGTTRSVVLILHGYGASGDNLIGLGEAWSRSMPHTTFIAPNGFQICDFGMGISIEKAEDLPPEFPLGYQWFPLPDREKPTIQRELQNSRDKWNWALSCIQNEFDISGDHIGVVGFSQGAMLSLYHGVYSDHKVAGIVGYSGGFMKNEAQLCKQSPPCLICHGMADEGVPFEYSQQGAKDLKTLGCAVTLNLYENLGHEINEEGFEAGGAFLKDLLY